ncbi:MAG TPA: DUF6167 family protein [Marmoricola sp.]|nr:DUF6167 family protein [Marmoricola sp.]
MRGIWFVAGTAAGVYATAKARRAAEALTVDGIHDRLTGWFAGARVLRDELRAGTAEKETELRGRLSLVPDGNTRQLTSGRDLDTTWKGDD